MTEMTKKVKSRTWEQLPEVYGLAVILVICVIGGAMIIGYEGVNLIFILPGIILVFINKS